MDDAPRREDLKRSIFDATEALVALEARRREIELILKAQEGELASLEAASKIAPTTAALTTIEPSRTTSEKIALFRQLFRGRDGDAARKRLRRIDAEPRSGIGMSPRSGDFEAGMLSVHRSTEAEVLT